MPLAARVGDNHVCPLQSPNPHIGGPILPSGQASVLIGGAPAAKMGDMCVCTGPADSIVKGSSTVFLEGKPAARMGDITAHGGSIAAGCTTVIIGG